MYPSWLMEAVTTLLPSIIVGYRVMFSTGIWTRLILWLTTSKGLLALITSSFTDIPFRYCLSRDWNMLLSLWRFYFCF